MEFKDSILFTTTCEGQVSNINFDSEALLIFEILKSLDLRIRSWEVCPKEVSKTQMDIIQYTCDTGVIRVPNTSEKNNDEFSKEFMNSFKNSRKNHSIRDNIMCIGCNYGEYKSYEYIKLITPIKKSNRGRKKKDKKKTSRKRIGNGEYFNSQVTFTVKDPVKLDIIALYSTEVVDSDAFTLLKSCMYHVKIYTNGKFQIPFVRDEDVNTVLPVVQEVVDIVAGYETVHKTGQYSIKYIKSIMKNYRFSMTDDNLLIDLKMLKQYFMFLKGYFEDKQMRIEGVTFPDSTKEALIRYFDSNWDVLGLRKITLVKYNNDNYTGLVVKFLTPIETKATKETTASIFDSNKINLYGCNNREESDQLKEIIKYVLKANSGACLYTKS